MSYIIVSCGLLTALFIVRMALGNVSGIVKLELGFSRTPGNRQLNADEMDYAQFGDETFLALADGIGPGEKGRTAARVAVHIISRVFELTGAGQNPAYFFMTGFRGANSTILRYIPDSTAGASLLCAIIRDGFLYYALAGNCRISVCRKGELYDLSEGHTFDVLARRAFQRREITRLDALEAVKESRIYNFVGKDGFRNLEMFDTPVKLQKNDIIILMTDGVYDFCPEGLLTEVLRSRKSCAAMARRITQELDRVNHPEQDNASVIVARVNAL